MLSSSANPNLYLPPSTRFSLNPDNIDWHRLLFDQLTNDNGTTPLGVATSMRDVELCRLLLNANADPNFVFPDGGIALAGFCAPDYLEVAKLMVDFGADPNWTNRDGTSAVYWSIVCGNLGLLRYMFDRGAVRVDTVFESRVFNVPRWTLLHLAVQCREGGIVRMVVERGVDINARDESGRSAVDLIMQYGDFDGVRQFLEGRMST
jgi:ankyrin repeat protein